MNVPIQKIGRFNLKGRFSHSKTFGSTDTVPATLNRVVSYIKDQGPSSYCTSAARSAAGSYFFGQDMSFEFQTAKEGEVAGSPIFNGSQPQTGDTACEEYGFLQSTLSPLTFAANGWIMPADWTRYQPSLDTQAIGNTAVSFNVYPDYQSIKSALIAGNVDNAVVVANGFWYQEWNTSPTAILPMPGIAISRHSYIFIDFKILPNGTEVLIAQLSQGTGFGDGGLFYFSEEVLNTAFANPTFNGLGCTIFRKGAINPVQTKISLLQKLIVILGQLYTALGGL